MQTGQMISHALTGADFDKIRLLGKPRQYGRGELIFSDGDSAEHIYFIEHGNVSIFIDNFTMQEEINALGPGDYFGEMAFFSGDRRSASARALVDSTLVSVDKAAFLGLYEADRSLASKIDYAFKQRNRELTFKEHLTRDYKRKGNDAKALGIKGDPSLRFSALERERYDSVVDRIMVDLQPKLYDLLLNRSAYEIILHCNSGEVLVRTIFDPLNGEICQANRLLNLAYIERHFPVVPYEEKANLIRNMLKLTSTSATFERLPDHIRSDVQSSHQSWEPLERHKLAQILSKLSLLRRIPNFYLRNLTLSIMQDTVRMQFNCDGTHIVNTKGFLEFIDQNLMEDDEEHVIEHERRELQRRHLHEQIAHDHHGYGERRSPPGRRQADWQAYLGGAE